MPNFPVFSYIQGVGGIALAPSFDGAQTEPASAPAYLRVSGASSSETAADRLVVPLSHG
jgi:hypothetical protein